MLGHLLRRVGASALTLALVALLVFLAVDAIPGDPARLVVGLEASPEEYRAARERLGLDDPWPVRFARWGAGFLRGDWGTSLRYGRPARELVLGALALTVPLAALALVLALLIAFPLGLLAARRVGGGADLATVGFAQLGTALPEFWLGVLLVGLLAVGLRWFPAGGFPGWMDPGAWRYLLLPAAALALPRAAYLARLVRGSVADVLREDYIRTARAKGVPGWRVLGVHALRNALVPVLTGAGLTFARLLAGAMVVENVFGLPGLGRLAVVAAGERDLPLLSSLAVAVGALVVLVNLAVDAGYALLDPRIRHP
ncbi:MAG: ABC transporter permease [Candidatus Bipolaricaulota bacterium]|nr:ABC transporter permease [Candidatus Bipolaricaulota bacterium]